MYWNNKVYKNVYKLFHQKKFNKWVRIREYNSPSGASVAINSLKSGKNSLPPMGDAKVAFTARTFGDKSRLYAYIIAQ